MDNYGITMKGEFICETVTSLPVWTSVDEGRLLYDSTNNSLYCGTNSEWVNILTESITPTPLSVLRWL